MTPLDLAEKAVAALSNLGDVYTDAPECAASVAAAQNLAVLGHLLAVASQPVLEGALFSDGMPVCRVSVAVDGTVLVTDPALLAIVVNNNGDWALEPTPGIQLKVACFVGASEEDTRWVIDDATAFYQYLLAAN